jgi:hypothetical protein
VVGLEVEDAAVERLGLGQAAGLVVLDGLAQHGVDTHGGLVVIGRRGAAGELAALLSVHAVAS